MAWKKVESYSFGFKPSDKKYWLYFVAPEECSRACSSAAFALIRAC